MTYSSMETGIQMNVRSSREKQYIEGELLVLDGINVGGVPTYILYHNCIFYNPKDAENILTYFASPDAAAVDDYFF